MLVFVDVDGVVADLYPAWLKIYHERYPAAAPYAVREIYSPRAAADDKLLCILTEPDLYSHVDTVPGAVSGVSMLRQAGHQVVFASSCVMGMTDAKWQWLQRRGFLGDGYKQDPALIIVHDKGLLRGDALVDDAPHNLNKFVGRRVLYSAPYNIGAIGYFAVANNWLDVVRAL